MQNAPMPCWIFERRSDGETFAVQRPLQPSRLDTDHRETLYDAIKGTRQHQPARVRAASPARAERRALTEPM